MLKKYAFHRLIMFFAHGKHAVLEHEFHMCKITNEICGTCVFSHVEHVLCTLERCGFETHVFLTCDHTWPHVENMEIHVCFMKNDVMTI